MPINLMGELTVSVPNSDAFLEDGAAQDAVKQGIASAFSTSQHTVLPIHVKLELRRINRRLAAAQRRLAGNVQIGYSITLPADGSIQAAALDMARKSTEAELTVAIRQKVAAVRGSDYNIIVTSKEEPSTQSAPGAVLATSQTSPRTTTPPCDSVACMSSSANMEAPVQALACSLLSLLFAWTDSI